ncbi:MAG: glycosyltransferase family 2 protein, partial [Deltaproteobacteria bacterium]|nr:glycosyltransferase family 2 protein [Deltaproteobacteria bacterium]
MVSIIIPAYNEENTIADIVGHIKRRYPEYEIIVVNDGSTDKTADVASTAGAVIVNHPYNIGNGAAIKSGIRHACGDILVFMDGDGQHDPDDIERMLEHLPEYDMVVGARKLGG